MLVISAADLAICNRLWYSLSQLCCATESQFPRNI